MQQQKVGPTMAPAHHLAELATVKEESTCGSPKHQHSLSPAADQEEEGPDLPRHHHQQQQQTPLVRLPLPHARHKHTAAFAKAKVHPNRCTFCFLSTTPVSV